MAHSYRDKIEAKQRAKQEEEERESELVRTCFETWRKLYQRESLGREMSRHHQEGCLRGAFISWREQVKEAEIGRIGDEVYIHLTCSYEDIYII